MDLQRKREEIKIPCQRCGKTAQMIACLLDWDLKEMGKEIRLCGACHLYLLERRAVTRTSRGVGEDDLVAYRRELADRPTLTRVRRGRDGLMKQVEVKALR